MTTAPLASVCKDFTFKAGETKDLADVQELIASLRLPEEFADQLNPFVRDKYRQLWAAVRHRLDEQ